MIKLTIKEYADREGISDKAVYKRLDQFQTVEERRSDGRLVKYILVDETAFDTVQPIQPNSTEEAQPVQPIQPKEGEKTPNSTDEVQPIQPNSTDEVQPIQPTDVLKILEKQLEEKDRQIERLQEEMKEQAQTHKTEIENLHKLLDQEQHLHAVAIQSLPKPEEENKAEEDVKKKKGFFKRLFGK